MAKSSGIVKSICYLLHVTSIDIYIRLFTFQSYEPFLNIGIIQFSCACHGDFRCAVLAGRRSRLSYAYVANVNE